MQRQKEGRQGKRKIKKRNIFMGDARVKWGREVTRGIYKEKDRETKK